MGFTGFWKMEPRESQPKTLKFFIYGSISRAKIGRFLLKLQSKFNNKIDRPASGFLQSYRQAVLQYGGAPISELIHRF